MSPKVSIVIPCYNQGHFLKEALESIEKCDALLYEVIIVNDGSTDAATNEYLTALHAKGYHVVFQENKGLAGARNAGIRAACGTYILPLDADNKIEPAYILKGIEILDSDPSIAVVYGDASYFGDRQGIWKVGAYNLQRLMIANFIDACAMIRRSAMEAIGLYDEKMPYMGWEDWDLWLRLSFAGHRFHYVEQVLFHYRVVTGSMIHSLLKAQQNYRKANELEDYFHSKYPEQLGHGFIYDWVGIRFRTSPVKFVIKLIMFTWFKKRYNKLLKQHKIKNGL